MGQGLNLSPVQSLIELVKLGKYLLDYKYVIVACHDTVFCRFFYKQTNRNAPSEKKPPFWVALEPQMWSFHLSSLDLSLELVQPKDEKVFYSLRRPKLENLIIVPAGDLLMLRHANWLVLFPVHLALASFWLWLWSFFFSLIFLY